MTRLMQLGAPCRIKGLVAYLPRDLSYFTESNCRGRPAILLNHSPVVAAKAMHYDLKMLVAAIAPSLRISGQAMPLPVAALTKFIIRPLASERTSASGAKHDAYFYVCLGNDLVDDTSNSGRRLVTITAAWKKLQSWLWVAQPVCICGNQKF